MKTRTCFLCNMPSRLLIEAGTDDDNSFYACEHCVNELSVSVAQNSVTQFVLGSMNSVIRNGNCIVEYRELSGRFKMLKTVRLTGNAIVADNSGYEFPVQRGDFVSLMKFWRAFTARQVSFHDFRLMQEIMS